MAKTADPEMKKPSSAPGNIEGGEGIQRKEIYTYQAPWDIFALAWSSSKAPPLQSNDGGGGLEGKEGEDGKEGEGGGGGKGSGSGSGGDTMKLAVGSFMEEYSNKVRLLRRNTSPTISQGPMTTTTSSSSSSSSSSAAARHQNNANNAFYTLGEFDHPYPTTKLMFSPQGSIAPGKELLATTGDYLRIWSVNEDIGGSGSVDDQGNPRASCTLSSLLNNNKNSEYCAPLTSFDWNSTDPGIVGTSSIDTTCTIWDIETGVARTQLIAHDKEVYDIAFARGTDVFASVGADGSVRMFDLRSLEHSTIIYESSNQDKKDPKFTPLLRLAWNKQDPNYLATVLSSSSSTVILDIRVPSLPVAVLSGHNASVNSIAWAPHSSCHICSAADDHFALIWDLSSMPKPIEDPILAYDAKSEINNLQWNSSYTDWIAIAFGNSVQVLRV